MSSVNSKIKSKWNRENKTIIQIFNSNYLLDNKKTVNLPLDYLEICILKTFFSFDG